MQRLINKVKNLDKKKVVFIVLLTVCVIVGLSIYLVSSSNKKPDINPMVGQTQDSTTTVSTEQTTEETASTTVETQQVTDNKILSGYALDRETVKTYIIDLLTIYDSKSYLTACNLPMTDFVRNKYFSTSYSSLFNASTQPSVLISYFGVEFTDTLNYRYLAICRIVYNDLDGKKITTNYVVTLTFDGNQISDIDYKKLN